MKGLSLSVASAWLQYPKLVAKTRENHLSISSARSLMELWVSDFDTALQTKSTGMSRSIKKEFEMYMIPDADFS